MTIIGVLAFVLALLISVMIHEAGHYLTAKKFGMKVTEFFVGFGKKLWSTQRGELSLALKQYQLVATVELLVCRHGRS